MRFPNKANPLEESSLRWFPEILDILSEGNKPVKELYGTLSSEGLPVEEYVDILDSLYALHKIDLDGEILLYVD